MKQLVILGGGGHGQVCAEIAYLMNKWQTIVILDDLEIPNTKMYKWDGQFHEVQKYDSEKTEFFVAVGNSSIRKKIVEELLVKQKKFATLIHPSAIISTNSSIDHGCVLMAGVIVNPNVKIGTFCILNTSCTVDHDCILSSYVHLSPGVHLAGSVVINRETWIGIGSTVSNNVFICEETTIGAGSLVVKNINEKGVYFGQPCKKK
ncbi:putative acetyltransferase [Carnobacterium maltaromaticum]|uniref:acetyltransferase n=1 Tax=Carnobacterium maltaromaticum TaxID=2751 RepID=UPI00191BA1FB|nr:acetyltransferase [Carnobacterium maltaromaticum]CAD5896983.1 putative acetyltransferase [Carnobacterium maltaromaticum]